MNKKALRQHYYSKRYQLIKSIEASSSQKVLQKIPNLLETNQKIVIYWPLINEIDLRGIAKQLPNQLALPAVYKDQLHIHNWSPGQALQLDDCGIPAPIYQSRLHPNQVGLLLAPALAFDNRGIRLGYGGGYYDRLRSDPLWRGIIALIVAPASYKVNEITTDSWDIPFDGWLTESELKYL
uniref:5-formyltetrahydrofolate cyclo-ligase n=1 Tax=Paulinella chromatophora TaxID=39717 RepID=B1X5G1_PAUCH|nr:hypothetical protein PCC_0765 [Paulinella chromatophora]ACB43180.1 hypothetical protein PCC_0765 [Paulinella chromatophora]